LAWTLGLRLRWMRHHPEVLSLLGRHELGLMLDAVNVHV
jgi:hypothetical protein